MFLTLKLNSLEKNTVINFVLPRKCLYVYV